MPAVLLRPAWPLTVIVAILLSTVRSSAGGAHAFSGASSVTDARQALESSEVHAAPTVQPFLLSDADPADVVPGEVTVTFKRSVSSGAATSAIASSGGSIVGGVPDLNVYEVRLADGLDVSAGIAALSALPGALWSEPVVRLHFQYHPNDPLYASMQQRYLDPLHLEQTWDLEQGDRRVVVAVVDSGVDLTHPDLQGQIWTNPNAGKDGCGDDPHGCNYVDPAQVHTSCPPPNPVPVPNGDVSPYYYHGTFLAGVLGAVANNGAGIAGIVPRATIMPVKVGDCVAPLDTAVANGILYAAHNGAQIISLSLSAGSCRPIASDVPDAISEAVRLGVLVVAASGDDGLGCVASPANMPGVLAVGSTAVGGTARARFSQWGPEIAVVAPGASIVGPVPRRDMASPFDLYSVGDGTSFSAPIVAGLADLLLSHNLLLTAPMLRSLIQRGATPLPDAGQPGWAGAGRIDMLASLRLVPAGYFGQVTLNGATVPDGTPVEARVGRQLCGRGVTSTIAGRSTYVVLVDPAEAQAGCGWAGALVYLSVGGTGAVTTPWLQSATALDLDARTGRPAGGAYGTLYPAGWNLVGAPAGTIYGSLTSPLYTLRPAEAAYAAVPGTSPVTPATGYWAYFAAPTAVTFAGDGGPAPPVGVPGGACAMVGNPQAARAVNVVGADAVYTYDPTKGAYALTTVLQPGQGAWACSSTGALVTLA